MATAIPTKEQFDLAATGMLDMLRQYGHADAADYLLVGFIDLLTLIKIFIAETVLEPREFMGFVQSHQRLCVHKYVSRIHAQQSEDGRVVPPNELPWR